MERRRRAIGVGLVVLVGLGWAIAARAEDAPATQPSARNTADVARQRFNKRQFERLTTKMVEVADLLEKSEPQTAKVLREAVNQAQRAFIAEDMEKVAQYLSRGLASAAAGTQSEVINELKKVLRTLRHGMLDLEKRLERIKQWKEFLDKIDKLLDKQKPLERQSHVASKIGEFDKRMGELDKRLTDIIARQKKLKDETGKLSDADPAVRDVLALRDEVDKAIAKQMDLRGATQTAPIDKLPVTGQIQKQLAGATEKLAGRIAQAGKSPKVAAAAGKLAAAAGNVKQAAGEMNEAADALGKSDPVEAGDPQDQALTDLKQARQALDDALAKMTTGGKADALAGRQDELSKKTGELAEAVKGLADEAGLGGAPEPGTPPKQTGDLPKAAEHMKKAADDLGNEDRRGALDQQAKALDELEGKKYEIAKLKRRLAEQARKPPAKQSAEQAALADQAEKLAKQMGADEKTPGQKPVGSASKSMGSASKKLSKGKAGQANEDQNKAIDELEKARQELSDAIDEEQEIAQAEQLAKIDQLLQGILERQVKVSAATRETHAKRGPKAPHYRRAEVLKLNEMSNGEGKLAEDVDKVRQMLVKEGNTVVFPAVLKEVHGDLADAQGLLAKQDAGPFTQAVQKEIERSLQEMIDSIRKELAERRKKGGGGGGGQCAGGKQPLVPPIAELKLLRMLQVGIHRRTVALDKHKTAKDMSDAQAAEEHKKLGARQESVRKMTTQLKAKLTRPRPGGGM